MLRLKISLAAIAAGCNGTAAIWGCMEGEKMDGQRKRERETKRKKKEGEESLAPNVVCSELKAFHNHHGNLDE
jgi:hypothetical protein